MRRGRLLFIIGGIILIVSITVGGYLWFSRGLDTSPPARDEGAATPEPIPTKDVVVAAQNIPRGTLITEESNAVAVRGWLADQAPETGIEEPADAYGRIARVEIVRGAPILDRMLTDEAGDLGGTGSDAALQIPSGKVAYALPVSRYSSVAWALQPGDHVDVILSLLTVDLDEAFQTILPNRFTCASADEACEGGVLGRLEALPNGWVVNVIPSGAQRPRLVTQLTVQDVTILRVGDWDKPVEGPAERPVETPVPQAQGQGAEAEATPEPRELVRPLTLIVDPQDAAVLKYAEETGASIDLVLRSADDAGRQLTTEPVTLEYLLEQFNIEVPPKLPYGVEPPLNSLQPGAAGQTRPLDVEGGRVPAMRSPGTAGQAGE